MQRSQGKLSILFFGHDTERCNRLGQGKSCHEHNTVPNSLKLVAGLVAPAFAIGWTVGFSGFWQHIEEAQKRGEAGVYIVGVTLLLLWLMSLFWTTHSKITTPHGYFGIGIAAPFSILSLITPLVIGAAF